MKLKNLLTRNIDGVNFTDVCLFTTISDVELSFLGGTK